MHFCKTREKNMHWLVYAGPNIRLKMWKFTLIMIMLVLMVFMPVIRIAH